MGQPAFAAANVSASANSICICICICIWKKHKAQRTTAISDNCPKIATNGYSWTDARRRIRQKVPVGDLQPVSNDSLVFRLLPFSHGEKVNKSGQQLGYNISLSIY